MSNIKKYWYLLLISLLLIVLPFILLRFISINVLIVLSLISLGVVLFFIVPFISDATNLPNKKSKIKYWFYVFFFFLVLPFVIYVWIHPITNEVIKFEADFGQGILTASTVLLALVFAAAGIIKFRAEEPLEKSVFSLVKVSLFISLLFGLATIIMLLRWFMIDDKGLLVNIICFFSFQISCSLLVSAAFIESLKKQK